jgi:hypothetical protein
MVSWAMACLHAVRRSARTRAQAANAMAATEQAPDCLSQSAPRTRPMVSFARHPTERFRPEEAQRINQRLICPNSQKDA